MNYEEYIEDISSFDLESQRLLLSLKDSVIPMHKLEEKGYGKFQEVITNKIMLGETIRGMRNVSPLAEHKFFNQTTEQIYNKYFPDSENMQKGNRNLIFDFTDETKNGFDFKRYNFFSDKNRDGKINPNEELIFKLLLFVSTDGNKVKECYEVVKPADDEIILFLETDEDHFSSQKLYGRISDKIRKIYVNTTTGKMYHSFFEGNIIDAVQKYLSRADKEIIEELLLHGYIQEKSIQEKFMTGLKYVLLATSAPSKALGWVLNKFGDGIDFLKIPDEFWDTESEEYYFQKDKIIENLSISDDKLNLLKNLFTDKKGFNLADLTPQMLDDIILKQISVVESFTGKYNNYVKNKIEDIYKTLENPGMQKQTEKLAERIALICGIWYGLVDFVSSVFKFLGMLLEAPFNITKDFQQILEMIDNFWDMLKDGSLFENLEKAVSSGIEKMAEYLKSKNTDDINWVWVYYIGGFTISFIGTFFIPVADLAKISEVGKIGEVLSKITSEVGNTVSKTGKFVKIQSAEAYQKTSKALQELLEMVAKGGKKLDDFVDKVSKEIAEWFLKNKKYIQSRYEKIADITAKELDWMASRRIGNLGGNILKETQIRKLRGILKRKEIQLIVDGDINSIAKLFKPIDKFKSLDELLFFMKTSKTPKVGLFHAGTRQMILTKDCTEIVAFHEMCHLKHFEEVGDIAYKGFNRLEKEMYVWKQILANRGKWTKAELKESLRYINEIRTEEYGLTPLKIN